MRLFPEEFQPSQESILYRTHVALTNNRIPILNPDMDLISSISHCLDDCINEFIPILDKLSISQKKELRN